MTKRIICQRFDWHDIWGPFRQAVQDHSLCEVRCYRDVEHDTFVVAVDDPFVLPIGETWRERHDRRYHGERATW
jgi:hypothetical protein